MDPVLLTNGRDINTNFERQRRGESVFRVFFIFRLGVVSIRTMSLWFSYLQTYFYRKREVFNGEASFSPLDPVCVERGGRDRGRGRDERGASGPARAKRRIVTPWTELRVAEKGARARRRPAGSRALRGTGVAEETAASGAHARCQETESPESQAVRPAEHLFHQRRDPAKVQRAAANAAAEERVGPRSRRIAKARLEQDFSAPCRILLSSLKREAPPPPLPHTIPYSNTPTYTK